VWIGKAPRTISSLHIGHRSFVLAAVIEGPLFPFSSCTLELRSWIFSARGEAGNGEREEASEFKDTVLSDGDSKFAVRWCIGGVGGAKDFPLPSILPPPSFRAAMAGGDTGCFAQVYEL